MNISQGTGVKLLTKDESQEGSPLRCYAGLSLYSPFKSKPGSQTLVSYYKGSLCYEWCPSTAIYS